MPKTTRGNVLTSGHGPYGASLDPIYGVVPASNPVWKGCPMLGVMKGDYYGILARDGNRLARWVKTDLGGATATFTLNGATNGPQMPFSQLATGATTNNHGTQIQLSDEQGSPAGFAPIVLQTGYGYWFETAIRINVAAAPGLIVGLAPVDTSVLASSAIDVTSLVGIYKAPASSTVNGTTRTASASTSDSLQTTIVAATWYTLGMFINGRSGVQFYWGPENGTLVLTGASSLTNLPANTVALTPTFAVANGTAPGSAVTLDYKFKGLAYGPLMQP